MKTPMPNCPYCCGTGKVSGNVADVEFIFECVCVGGSEESVRWLLGPLEQPKPPLETNAAFISTWSNRWNPVTCERF
jgi:hypothetical protein